MQNVDPKLIRVFADEINARGIRADMLDESRTRITSKLRRLIRETVRVYDGSPNTPHASKVYSWAKKHGFERFISRAVEGTFYYLKHPDNEDIVLTLKVHHNLSLGRTFIKASVDDDSRGYSGVDTYQNKDIHSQEELDSILDNFLTPIHYHEDTL